nr:ribonuclease H-like domain-containing protein [Tanacetum cinerariifolium]
MLKHFDREDLIQLWTLVKETLSIRQDTSDKEKELWVEPDVEDQLWTHTKALMHDPVEWRLYDSCRLHHVLSRDQEIFMLVKKDYPLRKGLAIVMIGNKLQVENYSQMASDLILKIHNIANSLRQRGIPTFSDEFLLPDYFPTASEERFPMLSEGDAPAEEVCTANEVVDPTFREQHTSTISGPVTPKEKAQKKNDVKARSMLLMALPNEHLLSFSQYKDAKTLFEAIQARFGGNDATKKTKKTLLKQTYENFNAPRTDTNEVDTATIQVSTISTPISTVNLKQIHEDDLEEIDLKWQLALLSMRAKRYFKRTHNSKTGLGFTSNNAVAPPPTGLFAPPTIDLSSSGLEEFKQPEFKSYGPKTSKSVYVYTSNVIKNVSDASIIEDWVSDCDKDESKEV